MQQLLLPLKEKNSVRLGRVESREARNPVCARTGSSNKKKKKKKNKGKDGGEKKRRPARPRCSSCCCP